MLPIAIFGLLGLAGGIGLPLLRKGGMVYKVNAPPPAETGVGQFDFPKSEDSVLAVTLDLPMQTLRDLAKQKVPRDISGTEQSDLHKRIRNGVVQYQFVPGELALEGTGKNLAFGLPIRGAARIAGDLDVRILQIPVQGQADLAGRIVGTLTPQINQDWRIVPNLEPALQLSHANVTLGRLGTINATGLVEQAANPLIRREVEKYAGGIDLRPDMTKLWTQAHLQQQVSEDPPVWIDLDPQFVSMGPIDYSNPETISVTLALHARGSVAASPGAVIQPEKLPGLQPVRNAPATDIRIPVVADVSELNKRMTEQTYSKGNKLTGSINIKEPELRVGERGILILGFHLDAVSRSGRKLSGRVWMKAKPRLDAAQQTIEFTEVQLTKETIAALPGDAASRLKEQLVKAVTENLRFDLKEYLPLVEEELTKKINSSKVSDDVQLIVDQPKLELLELYTVTRPAVGVPPSPAVVVVLGAKGKVGARVLRIPE